MFENGCAWCGGMPTFCAVMKRRRLVSIYSPLFLKGISPDQRTEVKYNGIDHNFSIKCRYGMSGQCMFWALSNLVCGDSLSWNCESSSLDICPAIRYRVGEGIMWWRMWCETVLSPNFMITTIHIHGRFAAQCQCKMLLSGRYLVDAGLGNFTVQLNACYSLYSYTSLICGMIKVMTYLIRQGNLTLDSRMLCGGFFSDCLGFDFVNFV